jgi:hypothetical protein
VKYEQLRERQRDRERQRKYVCNVHMILW